MEERLEPRVQGKNKLQAEMSKNAFCMWKETAKKIYLNVGPVQ
jgi:hypothetical protein